MAMANGMNKAVDAHGITQGDGGSLDRLSSSGGDGKDILQGHSGHSKYYGGNGSDTFILSAKSAALAHQGA